jgi:hypothetical protein
MTSEIRANESAILGWVPGLFSTYALFCHCEEARYRARET